MWKVIGAVGGGLAGVALGGLVASLALGFLGFLAGWAKDAHDRARSAPMPPAAPGVDAALAQRLDAIEARLARIEARQGFDVALPMAPAAIEVPAAALAPASAGRVAPPIVPLPTNAPPPRPSYGRAAAAAPAPARDASNAPMGPGPFDGLRSWLAGGNALTRVGVVILFFGVAFLLRYFAELAGVPIGVKLGAAAAAGLALAALGVRLSRARPAYGLALQGAGMGIVYMTVFAAFRLYAALPPLPSLALLVVVAGATIALALRHDSQALAALALAGGFLAPVLIDTGNDAPGLLFAWFAVLNGAVFAIAWQRSWRALNVLGFAFTFALGLAWGWTFYRPRHFAIVQPYLALFLAFYVGIAILYAKRSPLDAQAPVDGMLVFGVPLVGFALQAGIVRDFRHGEAYSAVALAAVYTVLWFVLRARPEPGLARLAKAFAALAVVFATLAIPFALDARWTSSGWAIEAAAVYWLGVVQRQRAARWFAIAVEVAAALAFLWDAPASRGLLFANAAFVGAALIGLAALAMVFFADRRADVVGEGERKLMPWLFAWGAAWWFGAGVREIDRLAGGPRELAAMLAWVAGTAAAGLLLARTLRWPRAEWLFVAVLPALAVVGLFAFDLFRTTLRGYGWLAWPLAWLVHVAGLRAVEAGVDAGTRTWSWLRRLHAVTGVAFVAWLAWEASEWTGRATADGTVWIACAAALPAIAYLAAVAWPQARQAWPLSAHAEAYGRGAGTAVALALAAWFAGVSVISPGEPHPWPYVPLANPLDLTLVAALAALWQWSGAWAPLSAGGRLRLAALAGFVAISGGIARAAYHYGDVAWNLPALFAHRPLQAALTLAWTVCALALMVLATRRHLREVWLAGAALLALVVAKLFLVDLDALAGLTRVVAFLGVGALLLVIGYVAPLPPARARANEG